LVEVSGQLDFPATSSLKRQPKVSSELNDEDAPRPDWMKEKQILVHGPWLFSPQPFPEVKISHLTQQFQVRLNGS
jgi:hypothetical protein